MLILALAALAAASQSAASPAAHAHASAPTASAAPSTGMHWGDFDADGFADAVALLPRGEARLLRNLGDGTLEDVTALVGLPVDARAQLALWGDYDADGALDLYLGSLDGESRLYRQAAGTFQDVTARLGLEPNVAPLGACWIDYDGDGTADLHLSTAGGEVLYHGLGGTAFERVDLGVTRAPGAGSSGRSVGSARVTGASAQPGVPGEVEPSPDDTGTDTAGRPGSSGGRTDLSVSGVTRAPNGTAALGTGLCVDGLFDQAGGACMQASSTPTVGQLFPISPELFVDSSSGFVGINETAPTYRLHVGGELRVDSVASANATLGSGAITVYRDSTRGLNIDFNEVQSIGGALYLNYWNDEDTLINVNAIAVDGPTRRVGINTAAPVALFHVNAGFDDFVVEDDGDVGVGTTSPSSRLHVEGGTDASSASGGFVQVGPTTGPNIAIDDNEIMARDNGVASTLHLNSEGGLVRTGSDLEVDGGDVKIVGTGTSKLSFSEGAALTSSLFYDGAGLLGPANRVHLRSELASETRNVMTWEMGGDVGIGTNTPETRLHISGGSDVSIGGGGYIQLGSQSSSNIAIDDNEIMARNNGAVERLNLNADGGDVAILGNSSTGDVGIGTSAPGSRLDVVGFVRSRGSSGGGFTASNPDDQSASASLSWLSNQARIRIGGSGAGSQSGLDIQTIGDASLMLIDGTGRVGIGTTSPSFLLHVNGTAGKPGGGSWSNSSDRRLKKNIQDLEGALDTLLALRGVTFEYIDPEAIDELPGTRVGFVAQEVEPVIPDWVDEKADGMKMLTVRGFEALAVEALRELEAENAALRERVQRLEALEAELARRDEASAALSRRMAELEGLLSLALER